ncbi:unnamed protein product [Rotaria socialis]
MSNSNFHRARPQSTRYSNNYDSSRVTYDHHFDSNQQSPVPLLGPSSQQPMFPSQERFHSNHAHQSNNRPFHHTENHLSNRMWSNTEYQEYFRRHYQQHFKIHIVCYNILAQSLLEDNQFLYMNCLRNNLQWHRRKERLLREILRQDADIVCLQEMENFHYENEFRPKFMEYAISRIYSSKTSTIQTLQSHHPIIYVQIYILELTYLSFYLIISLNQPIDYLDLRPEYMPVIIEWSANRLI